MYHTSVPSPIKLMIAEDHILYRSALRQSLSGCSDIECIAVTENGHELMQLLSMARVDVILLDINMPVMDGVQVLPLIRSTYPHIKVLILSMQNNQQMIDQLMKEGADGYLLKTQDTSVIFEAVRRCMQERTIS